MSFARFSDTSDLYVYESRHGFICSACLIRDDGYAVITETAKEMTAHVREHQELGHKVAANTVPDLEYHAWQAASGVPVEERY